MDLLNEFKKNILLGYLLQYKYFKPTLDLCSDLLASLECVCFGHVCLWSVRWEGTDTFG